MTESIPLILDTDIGTDVDDCLALAVLLGSPEIDLLGITTVYGDCSTSPGGMTCRCWRGSARR